MKSHRSLTILSITTILAIVIAACGAAPQAVPLPTATAAPATSTPEVTPPATSAQGTLIGCFDCGPGGVAQTRPYIQPAGNMWLMKLWSPLVSFNKDVTGLAPQLAIKWTPNADATVWTFNLRPNVKWHDGQPFTADDVKFTLELAYNPAFGWVNEPGIAAELKGVSDYVSGTVKEITGLKVVDPLTIEFDLTKSDVHLPYKLVTAFILPKHVLQSQDPAALAKSQWFLESPVGTGPFMIYKFVRNQYQDLVPNPYYWNGPPKLAHLINRYFSDDASAEIALQSGEIQFTYAPLDFEQSIKGNPSYQIFSGSSFVSNYVIFNLRDKALDDIRVRQAIAYAIDRNAIIKDVFKGSAYTIPCSLSDKQFWPSDVNSYDYNPTRAKQLLQEANWDSSHTLDLWTYYTDQTSKSVVQAIQAYLAAVGITVTPRFMDPAAYNTQFYSGQGWQLSYRGIGFAYGQPVFWWLPTPSTTDKLSWGGYNDTTLSGYVNAANSALTEKDYVSNLQAACSYVNMNALEVALWVGERFGAANSKVQNFYWFPAPAGGPYEDHPELWSIAP